MGEERDEAGKASVTEETERYLEALRGVGCRITAQRRRIVEVLLEAGDGVGAQDLFLRVRALDPSVGLATVYRTLDLLGDLELVHRREGDEGVQRFAPAEAQPRVQLVCRCCGRTQEAPEELVLSLRQWAAQEGFSLLGQRILLRGTCDRCRGDGEEPPVCMFCGECRHNRRGRRCRNRLNA